MTQDEIIEMATEAGLAYNHDDYPDIWDTYMNVGREEIMVFAKLVAAKEREACAKVCEALRETIWEYHEEHLKAATCNVCTNLAIAIRARGEQA